jgi:RimJ/RimL family protein N-acetyltransferase
MISERDLMRIQIETLFTHDAAGRLISVNEPSGKAAPRFFLGRTKGGNEWRFRHDVDAELVGKLEALCAAEGDDGELLRPPYGSTRYEAVLARAAPVHRVWAGPAYRFPADIAPTSDTVVITADDLDLIRLHFADWVDEVAFRQPFLALVQDGRAVSICCSVRTTTAAHEAGVETHEAFRGRGYAARIVSAWARAVRDLGPIPLYSTSWQNTASQAVAAKLGLVRYGTDLHIT